MRGPAVDGDVSKEKGVLFVCLMRLSEGKSKEAWEPLIYIGHGSLLRAATSSRVAVPVAGSFCAVRLVMSIGLE